MCVLICALAFHLETRTTLLVCFLSTLIPIIEALSLSLVEQISLEGYYSLCLTNEKVKLLEVIP